MYVQRANGGYIMQAPQYPVYYTNSQGRPQYVQTFSQQTYAAVPSQYGRQQVFYMNPQNGGIFTVNPTNGSVQPLAYSATVPMNRDMTSMAYVQPQPMRQQQAFVMNQPGKQIQTQQMQVQGIPQPQRLQPQLVQPTNQFATPESHPLQNTHAHQPAIPRPIVEPEYQQPKHPAQQQKHPTQQIVTHPTQALPTPQQPIPTQQLTNQHENHASHLANREETDLMNQRERPKPRRKGKYRDVSNPTTKVHDPPKYNNKARKAELEEEEVESLPPIPAKPAPYREEKPARSGPPGFSQAKRTDAPAVHQHDQPSNERVEEKVEAKPHIQNNVEKAKPTPAEPVNNDNRGWSRVIDTAPVRPAPAKPPQRTSPKDGMISTQKP